MDCNHQYVYKVYMITHGYHKENVIGYYLDSDKAYEVAELSPWRMVAHIRLEDCNED